MTALADNAGRPYRDGIYVADVPLQASTTVYQGSLVEIDAAGRVAPAAKAEGKTYFGVAFGYAKNGSTAGEERVDVRRKGAFYFTKTGTAVVGKKAYVADDNTVTDVAAGATACGRIIDADADGVWVELDV